MKRQQFKVTYELDSVQFSFIKFAWNSACKEINEVVKKIAFQDEQEFRLTLEHSESKNGKHDFGYREWQSKNRTVMFFIEKLA